jgi:adenylyltransferase/sulfurtransferase
VTGGGPPDRGTPDNDRYVRQVLLPEIGPAGQARLKSASALVVGAGGLGSPALQYLAAAGVGRIGIADPDVIELSNLHRQPIYSTGATGRPKAEEAASRIREINPGVEVTVHPVAVDAANAEALIGSCDVVLDCTDNFPSRYVLNDAAIALGKPLVHSSVHGFEGHTAVFGHDGGPCYRCIHPLPPPEGLVPDCSTAGVLGVLPGIVGTIQASEALKIITGAGRVLSGRMLIVDLLGPSFREIVVQRDPACPSCGGGGRADARRPDGAAPGAPAPALPGSMSARELRSIIASGAPLTIVDVREHDEYAGFNIGGVHIPLRLIQFRLDGLDRARPVVVVCESGSRSFVGAAMLAAAGFASVRNLDGGLSAWRRL